MPSSPPTAAARRLLFPEMQCQYSVHNWVEWMQELERNDDKQGRILKVSHRKEQRTRARHELILCQFEYGDRRNNLIAERAAMSTAITRKQEAFQGSSLVLSGTRPANSVVTVSA